MQKSIEINGDIGMKLIKIWIGADRSEEYPGALLSLILYCENFSQEERIGALY